MLSRRILDTSSAVKRGGSDSRIGRAGGSELRTSGSGTRRIFEERLTAAGYELGDFFREVSISSFVSIKALVTYGIGISFLYHSVVADEDDIGTFTVDGITEPYAFHVVYTRNTNAKNYSEQFLSVLGDQAAAYR